MIETFKISAAITAGAGTEIVGYTVEESLPGCGHEPHVGVDVSAGVPFKSGASIVVPLLMTVTATWVNDQGVVMKTVNKYERFLIGYEYTAVPSNVAVSVKPYVSSFDGAGCKGRKVRIVGTVNVTMTA